LICLFVTRAAGPVILASPRIGGIHSLAHSSPGESH
jgi:hypothetical protein